MNLVNSEYMLDLPIYENKPTTLVLENPVVMNSIVENLYCQCNGGEGEFVLSENDKILSLEKIAEIIINPFAIDFNARKIQSRLYSDLTGAESFYTEEKAQLQSLIIEFLDKLSSHVPYEMICSDVDLDLSKLFKMYDVRLDPQCNSLCERLSEYAKVISRLLREKLLILVSISHYLPPSEIENLVGMCNYLKMNILFIEAYEPSFSFTENTYIIDRDNCQIIK